jgi:predicted ribosome quality control (RQC) complex YloA/Tae2 family protein
LNCAAPENEFAAAQEAVRKGLLRRRAYALRKKASLKQQLERCEKWEEYFHEGQLLQGNLYLVKPGMTAVTVADWNQEGASRTISLDPAQKPHERVAELFHESKRMKAGLPQAKDKLAEAAAQLADIDAAEARFAAITTLKELHEAFPPRPPAMPKEEKRALPYHEFHAKDGSLIWVGKNARCNDKLTFHYANGSDWWLHVSGYPGSHVIIRMEKEREPSPDTLQDALQLALFYSKAKEHGSGEVVVTQRKYVSRLGKNSPGKVQISHHKTIFIREDKERLKVMRR